MSSRFGRMHTVGLVAALIAGSLVSGASRAEAQGAAGVARLLLEFEVAVRWETESGVAVVQPSWRNDRPGWVSAMQAARSPQQVAQGLLKLEEAMTWESVDASWRQQRGPWVARANSATTVQQVAALLSELEIATTWEAVQESWRGRRPGWVQELAALMR